MIRSLKLFYKKKCFYNISSIYYKFVIKKFKKRFENDFNKSSRNIRNFF